MSMGTDLLVQIFERFEKNNSKEKVFRRLYCESGQAGTKSCRFVNEATRARLEQIIPKCKDCKCKKLKTSTLVLLFEELTDLKEPELLKKAYIQTDRPEYAYNICNKKTQNTIQRLGLIQ